MSKTITYTDGPAKGVDDWYNVVYHQVSQRPPIWYELGHVVLLETPERRCLCLVLGKALFVSDQWWLPVKVKGEDKPSLVLMEQLHDVLPEM